MQNLLPVTSDCRAHRPALRFRHSYDQNREKVFTETSSGTGKVYKHLPARLEATTVRQEEAYVYRLLDFPFRM